jgi:hypothetical protein
MQVPFSGYVQDVAFLPPGAAGVPPSYTNSTVNRTTANGTGSTSSSRSSETQTAGTTDQHPHPAAAAAAASKADSSLQLVVAFRGTNCLNILEVQLLRYNQQLQQAGATDAAAAAESGSGSSGGSSGGSSSVTPVWSVAATGLVNMSEAGDHHVSFSAMRLAGSPCNR